MDFSLENHASFIGRSATELPTPSLIISKPVLEENIRRLHDDVTKLGISFRPHVKTLKSIEVTRMMLGNGRHRRIVASTLCEIRGAVPLAKEGILDECLYGLPVYPSALPHLVSLSQSMKILLMIDNDQQISRLEEYAKANPSIPPWSVFIKVDVGSQRAGLGKSSPELAKLVRRVEESPVASVYGFYCHAGHSYGGRTREQAERALKSELEGVIEASRLLESKGDARKVVVSVGSTPTAHVVDSLLKGNLPGNVEVELHAGNFPANDMQQVCTGLVDNSNQALRVLAEVCSVYSDRNEALINAGTVALSKETSDKAGYGVLVNQPGWAVVRVSQEHGIVGVSGSNTDAPRVDEMFRVGQKVTLYCQHACITAAAHHVYYIVDESDVVKETWVPWKGW